MNPLLARLRDIPLPGGDFYDMRIFNLAYEILMGDFPLDDKVEALQKINDSMGIDETVTVADVHAFIKDYSE